MYFNSIYYLKFVNALATNIWITYETTEFFIKLFQSKNFLHVIALFTQI